MRSFLYTLGILVVLCAARPAQAQFANRGMGLSAGYMNFNRTAGLDGGAFIGFDASLYIEGGFEVVSLTKITFPMDPSSGQRVIGVAPSLGVRYLFLEESIRPYLGTDISYLHVFKPQVAAQYAGFGPNAGVDFFVADSISLGLRAQYNVYLSLNDPIQTSLTLSSGVAVYY
jgi:outer membrane protein